MSSKTLSQKQKTKLSKKTFYKPFVKIKLAQYANCYRGPYL